MANYGYKVFFNFIFILYKIEILLKDRNPGPSSPYFTSNNTTMVRGDGYKVFSNYYTCNLFSS